MQTARNINRNLSSVPIPGLIFFFLVALFITNSAALLHAQPKLEIVGGIEFNLGVVPEDTIVHKTLIVRNIGTETLTVKGVRTSCGCTIVKPATDVVAPNDSMELPVSFNTKNFDGPVRKEIYFQTNDSTNLNMDVVLLAEIKAMIELRPHYLQFHEMRLHDSEVRLDTIRNNTDALIRIDSVVTNNTQITTILRDSLLNPGQFTILQTTLRPQRYGNIVGQINMFTNYSRKPSISLSYIGYAKK
jgi:hypothetical protein